MKILAFLLVASVMAVTGHCANATEFISALFANDEKAQIEKQSQQPLILHKAVNMLKSKFADHYSHSSHVSHSSHTSHFSSR